MAVRILPGFHEQLLAQTFTELAAQTEREKKGANLFQNDIVDWAERHYYIPGTLEPIKMYIPQKAVLRYMFTRNEEHRFPARTLIYSTVKKSGKTTTGGVAGRYMAETQIRYGDINCCGNDLGQAKEREFLDIKRSIELTPGFMPDKDLLPGRWRLRAMTMNSLLTHSRIRAISVDAKGEAGGASALSIFTELWGFDTPDAIKFWEEMTPAPTIPDSMRFVETYAGYDDGQSELLWNLYDMGRQGRQLTAGELAAEVCRENVPGETFQDFVNGWSETNGDPEVKIPVWRNDQSGIIMYWDSGEIARRMPWQHPYAGDFYDPNSRCGICMAPPGPHNSPTWSIDYYRGEMAQPPNAFRRHHLNEWVGAESAFVDIALWDACGREHDRQGWDPIQRLEPGDRTPLVVACDAAVSGDCFGIVAISRCPYDSSCVDIRGYKKWDPKETGGVVQFTGEEGEDTPENFLKESCKLFNVVQVTYDPFQLEDMMQRLRRDFISWVEPFNQGADRLKADSQLYDLITNRRIHHTNNEEIREHVANANAKLQTDEDSKLRIVKKKNGKKIDLCVAASMASARCLYLLLA